MRHAPASPATEVLQLRHPLDVTARAGIDRTRKKIGGILLGEQPGLLGITGPCAPTADSINLIRDEGAERTKVTETEKGLLVVGRTNVWKPRSNPEAWHGLETDNPDLAYDLVYQEATHSSGVAMEVNWQNGERTETHVERYGDLLTIAWFGARAIDDDILMERSALDNKDLPLAVKNGLDGDIDHALDRVAWLRQIRGDGAAPVVLLYRGGDNARDPESWERNYRAALERTEGRLIVDTAHGAEMAHDPSGKFRKSVEGQLEALRRVESIAQQGEVPAGVMIEASGVDSPVDPNIAHEVGLGALVRIGEMQRQRTLVSSMDR